jgi:hypothetical protein
MSRNHLCALFNAADVYASFLFVFTPYAAPNPGQRIQPLTPAPNMLYIFFHLTQYMLDMVIFPC